MAAGDDGAPKADRASPAPRSPSDGAGAPPARLPLGKKPLSRSDAETGSARGPPRRSPWLSAPLILGNEVASNVAYYSISTNMVIYLKNQLEYDDANAAQLSSLLIGMSYIFVLLGGYVADAFAGRAKAVLGASSVYVVGLTLLTLSAHFNKVNGDSLHTEDRPFFFVANVLIALAAGGIKPNVSALGADQFDDYDAAGRPSTDKTVFFGWYYFFINVGAILAATVLVWVQTSGRWVLGFAIPTAIYAFALAAYAAGWSGYRKLPPGGPPLARIAKTVVCAVRNRKSALPADSLDLYEADLDDCDPDAPPPLAHTPNLQWLDRAAVVPAGVSWPLLGDPPPTTFVPVSQVEETKQMLRLLPVWLSLLIWNLCYAQLASIMVQQAEQMNRGLGAGTFLIPPASVTVFSTATIIILVPAWDRLVRPVLEARSAMPTTLQRIGASNALMAAAMAVASLVELGASRHADAVLMAGGGDPAISVFWMVPQLVLMGVSEFFFVGAIEFFYQQSPERTRSLASALELVSYGIASFLNTGFIGAVSRATDWLPGEGPARLGKLENYYSLLAAMATVNLALFLWPVAAKYRYREFNPPKPADAAAVGLGRTVAGPALTKQGSMVTTPLARTLTRTDTIRPYASRADTSARLARAESLRAASRDSTAHGADARPASGRSPPGSGRPASAAARAGSVGAPPRTGSAGAAAYAAQDALNRISEAPRERGPAGGAARRPGDPRPPAVDEAAVDE